MSQVPTGVCLRPRGLHQRTLSRRPSCMTATATSHLPTHLSWVLIRQEGLPAPVGRVVSPNQLHLLRLHLRTQNNSNNARSKTRLRTESHGYTPWYVERSSAANRRQARKERRQRQRTAATTAQPTPQEPTNIHLGAHLVVDVLDACLTRAHVPAWTQHATAAHILSVSQGPSPANEPKRCHADSCKWWDFTTKPPVQWSQQEGPLDKQGLTQLLVCSELLLLIPGRTHMQAPRHWHHPSHLQRSPSAAMRASASCRRLPFSTPLVTRGMGMSRWMRYTRTQGGTSDRMLRRHSQSTQSTAQHSTPQQINNTETLCSTDATTQQGWEVRALLHVAHSCREAVSHK